MSVRRLPLAFVLVLGACGSANVPVPSIPNLFAAATTPPPAPSAAGLEATFVLANNAGLVALDAECHPIGRVVELPPQTAAATPSLSPDRSKLVFALTGQNDAQRGFGSDLYEVKLDGTGLRSLVRHEAENVFYASPRYDPLDPNALYAHRRAAVVTNGQYVGNTDEVVRVDLTTGARRTVVSDGADPTISPDGRTLVYVHLKDGLPDALWVVSLPDAKDAHPLLRTPDTFTYLQTPRFSPDGSRIVLSAAGRKQGRVVPGTLARSAHLGIPSEIFVIPADGSAVRSVGQTGDDVIPAWSPDGTRIVFVGVGAMVVLTVADGATTVCAQGQQFFFGDPVWIR